MHFYTPKGAAGIAAFFDNTIQLPCNVQIQAVVIPKAEGYTRAVMNFWKRVSSQLSDKKFDEKFEIIDGRRYFRVPNADVTASPPYKYWKKNDSTIFCKYKNLKNNPGRNKWNK